MSRVLAWTGLAGVLAYAVLAALFTLGFFSPCPAPTASVRHSSPAPADPAL